MTPEYCKSTGSILGLLYLPHPSLPTSLSAAGVYRRTYEEALADKAYPSIPVTPLSYGDAYHFLRCNGHFSASISTVYLLDHLHPPYPLLLPHTSLPSPPSHPPLSIVHLSPSYYCTIVATRGAGLQDYPLLLLHTSPSPLMYVLTHKAGRHFQ